MIQPHQNSGYYKRSQGYPFSCNDIGGVASSFQWFSCGGHRSHPERNEGGMSEGEVSPAAKLLK